MTVSSSTRLIQRNLSIMPPIATGGRGIWLHTEDGRSILDGSSGAAVSCLGHGNERVIDAICQQAAKHAFAHTSFFSSEPAEALAQHLVGDEPGGLSAAYFVSGGSEAMESALKLARQYWVEIGQPNRAHFIGRKQSYHGNTLGALAAGHNPRRKAVYAPLLSPAFSHVMAASAYRDKRPHEAEDAFVDRLIEDLETEIARLGPNNVAAFIAETVVGATGGCVCAPSGYFERVRAVCDRHDILLILDEVMCGMGRTGTTHAWEQEGVAPDIQAIAKGLGGGYQPIGAILVNRRVLDGIGNGTGAFLHGHTYLAHPIACAAALAVQQVIADDDLLTNVRSRGRDLQRSLTERFGDHPNIGDIRGRGLFWTLELVADRSERRPFDPRLGLHAKVKQAALDCGLACYTMAGVVDGNAGDHVMFAPPYIISSEDIEELVHRFGVALDLTLKAVT